MYIFFFSLVFRFCVSSLFWLFANNPSVRAFPLASVRVILFLSCCPFLALTPFLCFFASFGSLRRSLVHCLCRVHSLHLLLASFSPYSSLTPIFLSRCAANSISISVHINRTRMNDGRAEEVGRSKPPPSAQIGAIALPPLHSSPIAPATHSSHSTG